MGIYTFVRKTISVLFESVIKKLCIDCPNNAIRMATVMIRGYK